MDEVFQAKVVRLEKFGAFVNLFDKTDALVHVSEMAWTRVNKPEDLVEIGDIVDVKVIKIDDKGRIDASMKALLPKPEGYVEPENASVLTDHAVTKTTKRKRQQLWRIQIPQG